MAYKNHSLQRLGRISACLTEATGKHVRDYCNNNNISMSRFFEDAAASHLIKVRKIKSLEALHTEIKESYKNKSFCLSPLTPQLVADINIIYDYLYANRQGLPDIVFFATMRLDGGQIESLDSDSTSDN